MGWGINIDGAAIRCGVVSRAVQQNDAEAAKWFGLAAERGQVNAQFNLGLIFEDGRGVPKNDAVAAKWYLR